MRVLIGCECSGIVREEFRKKGHEAYSCDIKPSEDGGAHIQDDLLTAINFGWDMLIAHPPCTRLCNSGVRWLAERNLWDELAQARAFFMCLFNSPIDRIAIENPIPHKHAKLPLYTQIIQPWQHGHGETKATCLWLKNLPCLRPSRVVTGRDQRVWKMSPSPNRSADRARTYRGIARAMADQWS